MKTTLLSIGSLLILTAVALADIPLHEHPRPDCQRAAWVNLNGQWQFEFDPKNVGESEKWFEPGAHNFARQITVPFPWESKLSGIGDTEYKGTAWYSRKITLPSGEHWDGRDCWLIVGACDWEAKVWINGQLAAEHVGGYVPFEINLARFAKPGEKIDITLRAVDVTDEQQPVGKQARWYTRTSGIWQTVYLEARPESYIKSFRAVPDIANATVTYKVLIQSTDGVSGLFVASPEKEFPTVEKDLGVSKGLFEVSVPVSVPEPKLWSPESPKLYPVRFELRKKGKTLDAVSSYFGLREIKAAPADGRDYQYIYLNGKPVYLRGALHQSFHPDGIYQYPTDEVMRSDYELCKEIGINFLRIHIKAAVPRELYWADKLGVMIMQDMPNYWVKSKQAEDWYSDMLPQVIARDYNHPAIFSWVDFNETWGIGHGSYKPETQEWVKKIYHQTKELDPTRLVEDNSPCYYDHVETDINSWHFYINDYAAARKHIREVVDKTFPGSTFNYIGGHKQANAPLMNSEYGGIGAGQGDQDVSWCFKYLTNELRLHDKVCGYIYTELSDIEWEHNGFVNYDRTPKEFGYDFWFPGFLLADLNAADFVVIDAPPMLVVKPDEQREVPVRISHWSDHAADKLTLRYRLDWLDAYGQRSNGEWETREANWAAFKVVDQPAIRIDAAKVKSGIVGALLVEVLDGDTAVARNYINVLIDRGPLPRIQAANENWVTLRFGPMDFARWTFGAGEGGTQKLSADKVAGLGSGAVEYEVHIPKGLEIDRIKELVFLAELASKADKEKLGWPAKARPVSYPQTDVKKWPTDVVISINGMKLASVTLTDDPADARGALSHHRGYQGSYGQLVRASAKGRGLEQIRATLVQDRTLRVRLEVPADAEHKGGLAIFGQNVGCFPVEPSIELAFDGPHGLGDDYASNDPVARNTGLKVIIPTAESGRHTWRYTTSKPADDWNGSAFDDNSWTNGQAGFGSKGTPNAAVSTKWNTNDIWLRTTVQLDGPIGEGVAHWRVYHDEDVEIYVNGKLALELKGHQPSYVDVALTQAAKEAFKAGANTIAVHCHQTTGGQNVDVGLTVVKR